MFQSSAAVKALLADPAKPVAIVSFTTEVNASMFSELIVENRVDDCFFMIIIFWVILTFGYFDNTNIDIIRY